MIFDSMFLSEFFKSLLIWPFFFVAVFLAFYLPGKIVIGKNIYVFGSVFERIVVSILVGMVLWTYQGVIFGYLGLRFLSYVYLGFFFLLWMKQQPLNKISKKFFATDYFATKRKKDRRILWKVIKNNKLLLAVFLFGIFGQVQAFFWAGFVVFDGIHMFSAAADDAFWYTSLAAQIVRRFPSFEPGLVGIPVHNYHYWSSLITGELVRVFHLPLLMTQFQFMYLLVSFLLGAAMYVIGKGLQLSKWAILLLVYLQYFSSDILYIVTLITNSAFDMSIGPLEEGTAFLENPPRAFSIIMALGGVIFLNQFLRKQGSLRIGIIIVLFFGSLVGFKIHTGIAVVGGLAGLGLYFLFKKQWRNLFIPVSVVLISTIINFFVNKSSGSLIFSPFEMSRMFTVQPGFHISHFELARRVYSDSANFLQALRMDLTMLVIFLLSEFGIRNIGWLPLKTTIRQIGKPLLLFLYSSIFTAVIVGTLFMQTPAHGDTFNFYLAGSLFLSIIAGVTVGLWFRQKSLLIRLTLICIIAFVTMPRWVYKTYQSFPDNILIQSKPVIYKEELKAMQFVRENTGQDEVVLVFNQGQWDSLFPYVSIFTQRDMYLSGQGILGRHGISFNDRTEVVKRITTSKNSNEVKNLLRRENINILYFYGNPILEKGLAGLQLQKIYQSNSNTIYYFKPEFLKNDKT